MFLKANEYDQSNFVVILLIPDKDCITLNIHLLDFKGKTIASAGNRTRINCLEGSYADHYTTDAVLVNLIHNRKVKVKF